MPATEEHEFHNRKFSGREIAIGIGLLSNFGTLMWQTAQAAARWDAMRVEVQELKKSNAELVGAVGRNQLLEYRVAENERLLRELMVRRR